jgi:sodium/hydrogen exchanger 8
VDSTLSTLVFGESVLNDAISIVLYKTYYQFLKDGFSMAALLYSFTHFITIFFGSSALGILIALLSALLFKHVDLRKFPSLEISLMFISCYIPYLVGEGLSMSGILCLLANAIVNSHYTHHNLSKETQITLRQISQALSFICETMVFAYLGLAVFTYTHKVDLVLIVTTIVSYLLMLLTLFLHNANIEVILVLLPSVQSSKYLPA